MISPMAGLWRRSTPGRRAPQRPPANGIAIVLHPPAHGDGAYRRDADSHPRSRRRFDPAAFPVSLDGVTDDPLTFDRPICVTDPPQDLSGEAEPKTEQ